MIGNPAGARHGPAQCGKRVSLARQRSKCSALPFRERKLITRNVAGAGCAIFAVAASVKTDEFGDFKLADLADGHCVVKFEAEDYEAFETSVLVHDDDVVLGDVAIR